MQVYVHLPPLECNAHILKSNQEPSPQPAFFFPFMIIHYAQMYINMEEKICHYFDFIATLRSDSLSSRLTFTDVLANSLPAEGLGKEVKDHAVFYVHYL